VIHDFLNQAMTRSEDRLRNHPLDADAHYQVGAAYALLASYTATVEGRVLESVGAARRAYREHRRVLELDPSRVDAGLSVGLYRYAVSGLPAPLRLLARLAGFSGDRPQAIGLIERAAREGSDAQPNALFTLIVVYTREHRFEEAHHTIDRLRQRFPRNRLLWLEAAHVALRAGRPVEARTSLEEGLSSLSQDPRRRAPGEEARWRYTYGAALVALHDSAAADRELRAALAGATRDWVRGRAHKDLGRLADRAGDRVGALQEYRLADRLCRQDRDSECTDEAAALMNAPLR
jgi:tetratricopeptide (TPR) repeat protein